MWIFFRIIGNFWHFRGILALIALRYTFVILINPRFTFVISFVPSVTEVTIVGQRWRTVYTMCAVYQDLTPKFSLWDLFTADLQINQSFEHIHQEIWLEAAHRSRNLRRIIGWISNVIWRRESARKRLNLTSGVKFVPLPLVNPVVWFARAVVNRCSRSVAKLRRYKMRKAKKIARFRYSFITGIYTV